MEPSRSPAIASRENPDYQRTTGPIYRASFSTGGYRRLTPRFLPVSIYLQFILYLNRRLRGRGSHFWSTILTAIDTEIDSIVRRMADNPRQFPTVVKTLRRARAKKFPYALFFLVESDARQMGRSMLFVVTNEFPPIPNNPSRSPLEFQASSFYLFNGRCAIGLGCVCLTILASHQRGRQERQQE